MIIKKIYSEHQVARDKPINLDPDENRLFESEFKRDLPAVNLFSFNKVFVDVNGTIFKLFRILFCSDRIREKQSIFNLLIRSIFKRKIIIRKPVLIVHDDWYYGYFHWLADNISRLIAIKGITENYVLLLPRKIDNYHTESLQAFKFLDIHYVNKNEIVFANKIITLDLIAPTGNFNESNVEKIRNTYQIFCKKRYFKKLNSPNIFVSRSRAKSRKLINEEELENVLKKYNFHIVNFEKHSFYEQVNIMFQCNNIIAFHGSGLTNIIFGNKNLNVVEIRDKDDSTNNCYYSLASALKQNYYYLLAEKIENDYYLDKDILEAFIINHINGAK